MILFGRKDKLLATREISEELCEKEDELHDTLLISKLPISFIIVPEKESINIYEDIY